MKHLIAFNNLEAESSELLASDDEMADLCQGHLVHIFAVKTNPLKSNKGLPGHSV